MKILAVAYLVAVHAALGFLAYERLSRQPPFPRTVDALAPAGSAIFVGDSLTAGLLGILVEPNAVNLGAPGITTLQLADYLRRFASIKTARVVYVQIGTNDAVRKRDIGAALADVASALPPVAVVWTTIFHAPALPRDWVDDTNRAITAQCARMPRCTLVMAPEGTALFEPDGIHLSPEGYRQWIARMRAAR